MAKILLCSDLHTEYHMDWGKSILSGLQTEDVDVLVVAGDLTTGTFRLERNIDLLCSIFPEVVYVPGNHEYYGNSFQEIESTLMGLVHAHDNFTWLNNSKIKISGVNFIGATLWFPDGPDVQLEKTFLSDFSQIEGFEPEVYKRNKDTIDYLTSNIKEGDVVVTHHLPSYYCVSDRFKGSKFNCFFANNLDNLILNSKPAVWMYGHTHDAGDFTIGSTRLVCNPLAYPGEPTGFSESFIVEV